MYIIQKHTPPGGFEPPTFRLTAERASQLRHGGGLVHIITTVLYNTIIHYNDNI